MGLRGGKDFTVPQEYQLENRKLLHYRGVRIKTLDSNRMAGADPKASRPSTLTISRPVNALDHSSTVWPDLSGAPTG